MERQVALDSIRKCPRCHEEYEVEKSIGNEADAPRLPKVSARGQSICSICFKQGDNFTTPVRHKLLNAIVSHVREARNKAAEKSRQPTAKWVYWLIVIAVVASLFGVLMLATLLLHLEQSARRSSTLFDMLTVIQANKLLPICS